MGRLQGKVAAITGASLGIGRATALRMAEEGASVAILDCLEGPGHALAKDLESRGLNAWFWRLDVTKEAEVADALGQAVEAFGGLDVMVHNAGIAGANKPTDQITEAEWDLVQAVNVKGVFFGTKHAVPHMRRAGGGSIINISSIYGLISAPDVPPYHASKGAVRSMTKTDALIYAPDKIRVNSVHPGFIWTPMVEGYLKEQGDIEEGRKSVDALHPLGHVGQPDDIAWGCVYLASDEARFVTGSELVIDGGYTAH